MIVVCSLAVKEALDADDLNREREAREKKLVLLGEHIRRLVNKNAQTEIDPEEHRREAEKQQIALFRRMFEKQEADMKSDPGTFVAMVERVIVSRIAGNGIRLRFVLRNGHEIPIRL